AKGLGNGGPFATVPTRSESARTPTRRTHFNTFGGNPVSTAAALATLDVIDDEGLQENCRVLGHRFRAGSEPLERDHALVGEVRGMGLMLGVELVRDRGTKEPAKQETL